MKTRKFLALFLAAIMVITTFTGCNKGIPSADTTPSAEAPKTEEIKGDKILKWVETVFLDYLILLCLIPFTTTMFQALYLKLS